MKSKLFSLFLLTAILSIAMISAADFSVSLSNDLTKSVNETTLTITNNAVTDINITIPNIANLDDDDGHTIALSQDVPAGDYLIATGDTKEVVISHALTDSEKEDLALGTFSQTIEIKDVTDPNETASTTLRLISGYCEVGELREKITEGERYLEITSIKDKSSDTDWEWKPLDEVDIEVKVKFNSDDEDDDIDAIIEIGLYDTEDKEFIDLDHDEDLERDISLDEGERITETFTISVPVEDIVDSTSRYKLYIKVYQDGDEDIVCTDHKNSDYFQDIEIKKESYDVVLDELDITSPVPCGGEVEITARMYNTGSHDEDKTITRLVNTELDVDLTSNVYSLDEGDAQRISFSFMVPEDVEEKSYNLRLWTEFRYRESSDTYREVSEGYNLILKVEGNCQAEEEKLGVLITAELDPETPDAIAGKQVIIKATIRNTGDVKTTYLISVLGNSAWSSLSAIDPQTITLDAGESKDANIFLDIDEDANGEQEFIIRASYNGQVTEQKVALVIEQGVTQDVVLTHLRENWFIYIIAIINIILIIAIIAVVKSMVSRTPAR